jgi:hypothetical protein
MNSEKIDYTVIIADLEAKRQAIDNAIASLRALAGLEGMGSVNGITPTVTMPFGASGAGEIPDGSFHGKTIPEAIHLYLELMRKKQTAREISDGLKKGGVESTSKKWFDKIIYATLDRLKKSRQIVKIGSEWGLPEWYPALMRAGQPDSTKAPLAKRRKIARNKRGNQRTPTTDSAKRVSEAKKGGASDKIVRFLRENIGAHSLAEVQAASGVENKKTVIMLLGKLAKLGKVEKTEDGYKAGAISY